MRPQFPLWRLEVTTSLSAGRHGGGELRQSQSIGNYFVKLTEVMERSDPGGEGAARDVCGCVPLPRPLNHVPGVHLEGTGASPTTGSALIHLARSPAKHKQ